MYDFFVNLLSPLMWGEAWVMTAWHQLFVFLGIPYASGWGWALSIVGLTMVVRFLMIPLFVKQIHSSRRMQMIQPEMQKIQAKYKGKSDPESRQKMTQETMDLYKRTGSNPFSSCLPILLQMPIFLALFRILDQAARNPQDKRGLMTPELNEQLRSAVFAGGRISDTFLNAEGVEVRVLAAVLVLAMTATTFLTQRQLMSKNMPADALSGPYAQQQKLLLYVLPLVFAVGGIAFPIGVLLYWTTSNLWTMGQQFLVIRNMPTPGSEAARAREARLARKGKLLAPEAPADAGTVVVEERKPAQRQQPVGKNRAKKQAGTKNR